MPAIKPWRRKKKGTTTNRSQRRPQVSEALIRPTKDKQKSTPGQRPKTKNAKSDTPGCKRKELKGESHRLASGRKSRRQHLPSVALRDEGKEKKKRKGTTTFREKPQNKADDAGKRLEAVIFSPDGKKKNTRTAIQAEHRRGKPKGK